MLLWFYALLILTAGGVNLLFSLVEQAKPSCNNAKPAVLIILLIAAQAKFSPIEKFFLVRISGLPERCARDKISRT